MITQRLTFIFPIDGNVSDGNCIGSDKPLPLHMGAHKLSQYNCILDGATLKSEGMALSSSPKPRYPLHHWWQSRTQTRDDRRPFATNTSLLDLQF